MIFVPKVSILPWDRTARDWKVRSIGNAEVGGSLVGTGWLFFFQSRDACATCLFAFVGAGVGAGSSLFPFDFTMAGNGAPIHCGWRGFSAANLDSAWGSVIDVGLDQPALHVSLGTTRITAFDGQFIPYFTYQPVPGPDSTPSIGASWALGHWRLLALMDHKAQTFWSTAKLNAQRTKPRR
ncbi:MAG: hypothetical protein ABSE46_20205 [Terracidiphilus sp.]|jgi:hypothetical protein